MQKKDKKIFIVAGESSGDMHSSALVKKISSVEPKVKFKGIGGDNLQRENVGLIYHLKEVNFIGFSSIIKNYSRLKNILNNTADEIINFNPDAVILTDFPGFNLNLASKIRKKYGGKIFYYISPQLWAWHESRVKSIKQNIDQMLVVFPFEVDFYRKHGIEATLVENPLAERIDRFLEQNEKLMSRRKMITFMPGSRKSEIEKMLPIMIAAAKVFSDNFECQLNLICSVNFDPEFYISYVNNLDINLIQNKNNDENYKTILNSDLVVAKSGTSTMECALIGTPFMVCYKAEKLNYWIARLLIKVKFIAMVNIIFGREVVKELIQNEMTAENIFNEGKKILTDDSYRSKITDAFKILRSKLTDKEKSQNAAEVILSGIE